MKGYQKDLEIHDIYRVLPEDETRKLADRMEAAWFEQVTITEKKNERRKREEGGRNGGTGSFGGGDEDKSKHKPSLVKALMKVFGPTMAIYGVFAYVEEAIIKYASLTIVKF